LLQNRNWYITYSFYSFDFFHILQNNNEFSKEKDEVEV
jgi:hypothetical protein